MLQVKLVCFGLLLDIEVRSMSVNGMRDKVLFCSVQSDPDPIFQPSIAQQKINKLKSVSGGMKEWRRVPDDQIQESYQKSHMHAFLKKMHSKL